MGSMPGKWELGRLTVVIEMRMGFSLGRKRVNWKDPRSWWHFWPTDHTFWADKNDMITLVTKMYTIIQTHHISMNSLHSN
jgi:hypothetical protein